MTELREILAEFTEDDHVTVTGVDTRGHNVTRSGYLLAPAKTVNAQRSGIRTKGWRLCVGPTGMDPAERSTWVTVFPDAGTIEHTPEPDAGQWSMTELRHVPGIRASSHNASILYGGRGGARSPEPTQSTAVTVAHTGDGIYELRAPDTNTVQLSCRLSTRIWWARLPNSAEHQGS
ncbi:hypothetical protein [Streptomyces noursei]|uniref:hypothetical protein n=1 Tax=Streptomyces noursei TaxID=1971 RepID=UPI0016761965|nr:hypothetical protein [Streptomyces noursei]MCZ1021366.1 hypothetical protein [Streptomyces noursei]GGX54473.1 hypothetical protein GCM10010341_89490 [Streptomyces noursei]